MLLHLNALGMSKKDMALEFGRTESAVESRLQFLRKRESVWTILWNWLSGLGTALNKILFDTGDGGK